MMIFKYDQEADAGYVDLHPQEPRRVRRTVDLGYGIWVDLDKDGTVLGIEILTASE